MLLPATSCLVICCRWLSQRCCDSYIIVFEDGELDLTAAEAVDICCPSCGIAEVDDIKLKDCDDCDLVKYCSDKCQQDQIRGRGRNT